MLYGMNIINKIITVNVSGSFTSEQNVIFSNFKGIYVYEYLFKYKTSTEL